jgi:fatty-acyl-CoA synthase
MCEGENTDHEDIMNFCRGQIAHYKVPKYVYFVESFPMTVTGKIQKYLLREYIKRHFG